MICLEIPMLLWEWARPQLKFCGEDEWNIYDFFVEINIMIREIFIKSAKHRKQCNIVNCSCGESKKREGSKPLCAGNASQRCTFSYSRLYDRLAALDASDSWNAWIAITPKRGNDTLLFNFSTLFIWRLSFTIYLFFHCGCAQSTLVSSPVV